MASQKFDVIIAGGSFAGLTLAHHLPKNLKVLIVDSKPSPGFSVESTGLITEQTRREFNSFFPIDRFITNPITSICVIAPHFKDYFISKTNHPWIFQTDTKALVRNLAETLPHNVTFRSATTIIDVDFSGKVNSAELLHAGKKEIVSTDFLVGADGGHSRVAQSVPGLDKNKRFLLGYEEVYFGTVHLGPEPEQTIYHFWFGEFSLGYGGWLSPTVLDGKKAFRIGLAKLEHDRKETEGLLHRFMQILLENGTIKLTQPEVAPMLAPLDRGINGLASLRLGLAEKPYYRFGSMIPIGGALQKVHVGNVLLIGDAAGLCGAFAADGIKGSVISGKVGASVITRFLNGDANALESFHAEINSHGKLMEYYKRQVRYRWIWDRMKRNRTFRAMYNIISAESDSFLDQFCDSKDKRKSLTRVVVKFRHISKLIKYAVFLLYDLINSSSSSRIFA